MHSSSRGQISGIHSSNMLSNDALSSLRQEISELRSRLASRTSDGLSTPDSPVASSPISDEAAAVLEWRSKYDRLYESYRRLQKTNGCLEDKLLRVVDKFDGERNQMTRDLAAQTQKLVEAKLTIQRLSDQNRELQSDLNLSINLLRNKPNSFVTQKIDNLPKEVRSRVKNYVEGGGASGTGGDVKKSEGKKIRVAIPDDLPLLQDDHNADPDAAIGDRVSAAILAKVLAERDKERRAEAKFCIDVGTQTHGWHLNQTNSNNGSRDNGNSNTSNAGTSSNSSSPPASSISSASASPPTASETRRQEAVAKREKEQQQQRHEATTPTMAVESSRFRMPVSSNILLASVIHPSVKYQHHPDPQGSKNVNVNKTTSEMVKVVEDKTSSPGQLEQVRRSPSLISNMLSVPRPHFEASSSNNNMSMQRSATFSSMQTDI